MTTPSDTRERKFKEKRRNLRTPYPSENDQPIWYESRKIQRSLVNGDANGGRLIHPRISRLVPEEQYVDSLRRFHDSLARKGHPRRLGFGAKSRLASRICMPSLCVYTCNLLPPPLPQLLLIADYSQTLKYTRLSPSRGGVYVHMHEGWSEVRSKVPRIHISARNTLWARVRGYVRVYVCVHSAVPFA